MTQTMDDRRKLSVCFAAHNAFRAISGASSGHIGGIERQQSLMAKWLAWRGHQVSMLTWDEGQPDDMLIDGVRVLKMCRSNAGIAGIRFIHPKWTSLVRAMRKADADVYYHNCGEYSTGQVAHWCRCHGRKLVYSVASDPDCDPRLPEMHDFRSRLLYRYGLQHAHRVIVQTRRQQRMLKEGWHLDSTRLPMPCPRPSDGEYTPPRLPEPGSRRVLWVGRICKVKRPDYLLAMARACPNVLFDFVGPRLYQASLQEESKYSQEVYERALLMTNVTAHGPVPWERMPEFYRRAFCLCCTSAFEGFPNTFLEAWSHGLPVVTTFDPDDLIARRELGLVAGDVAGLTAAIHSLLASPDLYRRLSQNALQYYLENHTVEAAMPRFEQVFLEVLNAP